MKTITIILGLLFLSGCGRVRGSRFESVQYPVPVPTVVGPVGPIGGVGPQGPSGHDGQNGATGPQGSTGAVGAIGATGPAGSNGTNGDGYQPGLECDVYSIKPADESGTVNWNTMLSNGTLKFTTTLANLSVPNENVSNLFASFTAVQQALIGTTDYALDCSGYLYVPETGSYTLTQGSDDGSELAIDQTLLINMPQLQAYSNISKTVQLFAGRHMINVVYFQGPATNMGLTLSWQGPANAGLGTTQTIPASVFSH